MLPASRAVRTPPSVTIIGGCITSAAPMQEYRPRVYFFRFLPVRYSWEYLLGRASAKDNQKTCYNNVLNVVVWGEAKKYSKNTKKYCG